MKHVMSQTAASFTLAAMLAFMTVGCTLDEGEDSREEFQVEAVGELAADEAPSGEVWAQPPFDDSAVYAERADDGQPEFRTELFCYPAVHEACGSCGTNKMRWNQLCYDGYVSYTNTWCNSTCAQ